MGQNSLRLCALRGVAIAVLALLSAAPGQPSECAGSRPFLGFDSRLSVSLIGRLPTGRDAVRGFELVRGRPTVALDHRLVVFLEDGGAAVLPVLDEVRGLAVDASGRLAVDTGRILTAGERGLTIDAQLTGLRRGALHGSGGTGWIEVAGTGPTRVRLLTPRLDYRVNLIDLAVPVAALSWNPNGLALATGDGRLYSWRVSEPAPRLLARDAGLAGTRDVTLIAEDRAVLALRDSILLVQPGHVTTLVAFRGRIRWSDGTLYLLDERNGLLWRAAGIERVGPAARDIEHARSLVARSGGAAADPTALGEAARLVGCATLAAWRQR